MSKLIPFFKKFVFAALALAIGLAVLPVSSVFAADIQDQTTPPNDQTASYPLVEHAWSRLQIAYDRESNRLATVNGFLSKAQSLIDKAAQKGWDTSVVQAALNAFASVIPAAQAAHEPGAAIIASHSGFDATGKVTDRVAAAETVKALALVLKNTHAAMNGTGLALRDAVKAFREAHKPSQVSTSTP